MRASQELNGATEESSVGLPGHRQVSIVLVTQGGEHPVLGPPALTAVSEIDPFLKQRCNVRLWVDTVTWG